MIIIGEKLNSSVPLVKTAIENYDEKTIMEIAKQQEDFGAHYLDVNAGTFTDDEPGRLVWLINTVRKASNARLMIDSPNPNAIEAALKADTIGKSILNSVTLEKNRLSKLLPLAIEYNAGIVALPMDENGMPKTPKECIDNAEKLIYTLREKGIADNRIYIDALVKSVGTDSKSAEITIETIRLLKKSYPDIHIICGVSNVSFGLPQRMLINTAFLSAAIFSGLDCAIVDITKKAIRDTIFAAEVIAGNDEYCMNYINYTREN